jgi:predicted esterase
MFFLFVVSFALAATAAAQSASPNAPQERLESGKLIERIVCTKTPEQSYALYLPSNYSSDRSWPVVFAFDPGARGRLPVDAMKDAAERYGYLVLGSNNSRNGGWKPEVEAADAMLQDAQARFTVDLKRIYFAGFSGGARVASQLAQNCKCAAGVLLNGAGFSLNSAPARDAPFPVFSAVGNLDFNYSEVIPLQEKLEQAGYPRWLHVFEGRHEWAPAKVMDEALAWFRIQAMRTNHEPRDEAFIATQLTTLVGVAEKENAAGNSLAAWRIYRQIAATFDGIANVSAIRAKVEELSRAKSVRDGLKRERSDFDQQEKLSNDILGPLQSAAGPDSSEPDGQILEMIRELRLRAEKEKHPDQAAVLKRALAGIFIGAIESGNNALDKKEYRAAARYFSAAAEVRPDPEWPLRQLAIALAFDKNRKAALDILRRIKPADPAEFQRWLKAEPAFDQMRAKGELKTDIAGQ